MHTIQPTEDLLLWMSKHGYSEPHYVNGQGWYAFKNADVIPVYIGFEYYKYRHKIWKNLTVEKFKVNVNKNSISTS